MHIQITKLLSMLHRICSGNKLMKKWNGFDFGDFEITKREILASISIIAVLLLIGFIISGEFSVHLMDKNEKYNKAVKIKERNLFEYGMRTDIGNAFVYGDLEAVDTVTYPEIGGKYMYVRKVEEHYTMHTRQVAHTTTVNGHSHTYYTTEVYWSWDYVGSEDKACEEVSFLKHIFSSKKIQFPDDDYIDTLKESSHVRFKYYGVGLKYTGTIFTELKNKTIKNNSPFYENMTIDKTVEHLESDFALWLFWLFWIFWIILIGVCVYGFYYIDNEWLE